MTQPTEVLITFSVSILEVTWRCFYLVVELIHYKSKGWMAQQWATYKNRFLWVAGTGRLVDKDCHCLPHWLTKTITAGLVLVSHEGSHSANLPTTVWKINGHHSSTTASKLISTWRQINVLRYLVYSAVVRWQGGCWQPALSHHLNSNNLFTTIFTLKAASHCFLALTN